MGHSFGDWWGNEGTSPDDGLDQGVVIANSPMLCQAAVTTRKM